VAEQIDRLYWNAGERSVLGSGGEGEEWEVRGCDLRAFLLLLFPLPKLYGMGKANSGWRLQAKKR